MDLSVKNITSATLRFSVSGKSYIVQPGETSIAPDSRIVRDMILNKRLENIEPIKTEKPVK